MRKAIYKAFDMLKKYNTTHGPVRWAIAMVDILLVIVCMTVAYKLAFAHHPQTVAAVSLQKYIIAAIAAYIPAVAVFRPILMYRVVRGDIIVQRTLNMCLLHVLMLLTLLFAVKDPLASRGVFVFYAVFITFAVTVFRLTTRRLVSKIRKSGHNVRRILLAGPVADLTELHAYLTRKEYGIEILGIFTSSSEEQCTKHSIKRLGSAYELLSYLQDHEGQVDALFCATGNDSTGDTRQIFSFCENHLIPFHLVPAVGPAMGRTLDALYLGEALVLAPRKEPLLNFENRAIKRALDLLCSALFLLTVFPIIYIVAAVIIKLKSPGPVLVVHERTGWNKRAFRAVKFRTAPYSKEENRELTEQQEFPFGSFMRQTRLDKLPMFINVFFGSMSLVGPCPHCPQQSTEFTETREKYNVNLRVKPGLTGWDRIQGHIGEDLQLSPTEQRIRADIWYAENWTFWLDLRIIYRSLFCSNPDKNNNA